MFFGIVYLPARRFQNRSSSLPTSGPLAFLSFHTIFAANLNSPLTKRPIWVRRLSPSCSSVLRDFTPPPSLSWEPCCLADVSSCFVFWISVIVLLSPFRLGAFPPPNPPFFPQRWIRLSLHAQRPLSQHPSFSISNVMMRITVLRKFLPDKTQLPFPKKEQDPPFSPPC